MGERLDWQPARLRAVRDLTPDIRLFKIAPERFIAPTPGSNIAVAVQINGRPGKRHYSVVGPCADGLYRIAVKRLPDSRGGSLYLHGLRPGALLSISAPENHFRLSLGRPDYLLVAGGIGITPIYGMALALAAAGAPVRLLYACRREVDLAFADALRDCRLPVRHLRERGQLRRRLRDGLPRRRRAREPRMLPDQPVDQGL